MQSVRVELSDGTVQEVTVDPKSGPLVRQRDGSMQPMRVADNNWCFNTNGCRNVREYAKQWSEMGVSERTILLDIAARKNRAILELGDAQPMELPDFLQGLMPWKFDAEDQNSFFQAMTGLTNDMPADGEDHPVLVLFYSGGMSPQQGKELIAEFLETAKGKGFHDQVILHHADQYDIDVEGTDGWPMYVDALVDAIDSKPELRGRPLFIWGHSKGTTAAMTLAARVGSRALSVYLCASGAPTPGEVSPFQTMAENFKKGTDLDLLKWFCTLNADRALHRMVEACEKGELEVSSSPYLQGKLAVMKKQYVNTVYPDMERDFQVLSTPIMALWPQTDQTSPKESMEAWQVWTTGPFKLQKVAAGHMDCLRVREHHDNVVADMVRIVRQRRGR
mmetsp:Transcript_45522/g.117701  ORF Transcript_45522/g.117701 Transcript_45522/m.117701 type:complete len:391 (-) Transcript_45522:121-1293(-)